MAQIAVIFIIFLLGLILGIVGIVLRIFNKFEHGKLQYFTTVRHILGVFPPFALAEALHGMTTITTWNLLEQTTYKVSDWKIAGMGIAFMGWETVIFLLIVIVYDFVSAMPSFQTLFRSSNAQLLTSADDSVKDSDVKAEEQRVRDGQAEDSAILVNNIKKVYAGGKFAVKGVSLGIPNGECFGLLGTFFLFSFYFALLSISYFAIHQ